MAVPKYDEFMLPLLKLTSDGKQHAMSDAFEELAQMFRLSEEDRRELLPSGQGSTFENRVSWARTYLKKAGLLESRERGTIEITERGRAVLVENPSSIDKDYLMRFPEFVQFQTRKPAKKSGVVPDEMDLSNEKTPKEIIEDHYMHLKNELAEDLLARIKGSTDSFFERLVVDLLIKMGYGGSRKDAGRAIGKSGDHGIDGIIKEDKLGLDVIYIQAKKWTENKVGEREIRDFLGSLHLKSAHKGVFITTSAFTREARESAQKAAEKKIILIDGDELCKLMIEHNLAVSTESVYEIKRVDNDYFEEV